MTQRQRKRTKGDAPACATSAPAPSQYRGSTKHKNRPADEQKGTLCPEWSHETPSGGFATDPSEHDWGATLAHRLFATAIIDGSGRRFATWNGLAFEAKATRDGVWHGFPIPWETVPCDIKDRWIDGKLVSGRQTKLVKPEHERDIYWALKIGLP